MSFLLLKKTMLQTSVSRLSCIISVLLRFYVVVIYINHFKKADQLGYLLRNSLVSPSLLAGIWNAKYVNAAPLYRQEQEFQRMGLNIDRADMAHWTILCAERYLSIFYYFLHEKLYDYHVLQADETPILVSKENKISNEIMANNWYCDAVIEELMSVLENLQGELKIMITYVKGDIFTSPAKLIVNTVNTVGVMGKNGKRGCFRI